MLPALKIEKAIAVLLSGRLPAPRPASWKSTCVQLLPPPRPPCNRQSALLPWSPPASGPSCRTLREHPSSSRLIRQTRCSPSSTSRLSPSLFWGTTLSRFLSGCYQQLPFHSFSVVFPNPVFLLSSVPMIVQSHAPCYVRTTSTTTSLAQTSVPNSKLVDPTAYRTYPLERLRGISRAKC